MVDFKLSRDQQMYRDSFTVLMFELREEMGKYLASLPGENMPRSLADLIAFNEQHREVEMPHFGQEFFEQAEKFGTLEIIAAGEEARALARLLAGPEGIDAALHAHDLDALICPTNDPAGVIDLKRGDAHGRVASTPAAVAGYPHLTVPMGFVDDLPVGFSFMGSGGSDTHILSLGHAFELITQARRPPALVAG